VLCGDVVWPSGKCCVALCCVVLCCVVMCGVALGLHNVQHQQQQHQHQQQQQQQCINAIPSQLQSYFNFMNFPKNTKKTTNKHNTTQHNTTVLLKFICNCTVQYGVVIIITLQQTTQHNTTQHSI